MDNILHIYVDQLREGHVEQIDTTVEPAILDVNEEDLHFNQPVNIQGEAYLAENMLVLHLDLFTTATIPCAICNRLVESEIKILGFYHAVPLQEIKSKVYDMHHIIRETILLETPTFVECDPKGCPERKDLEKYFKKPHDSSSQTDQDGGEDGYQPFADIKF